MKISVGSALGYSLLGFAIVFAMLILLMIVIKVMGAILKAGQKKDKAPAATAAAPAAPVSAPAAAPVPAPGSAGEVKLYDVSDKDAAMIMAIVADKMQKPLNELRFKSIREVK